MNPTSPSAIHVLVGSTNPVKIRATETAFRHFFETVAVQGHAVSSGVPDQPVNDDTFAGARNRVLELQEIDRQLQLDSDYFVGIEGGIVQQFSRWFAFGGICIMNRVGQISYGTSSHFELPAATVGRLLRGEELGEIADEWTGAANSKQKGGAISYLTRGCVQRTELYVHGLIVALIPFLNPELYFTHL